MNISQTLSLASAGLLIWSYSVPQPAQPKATFIAESAIIEPAPAFEVRPLESTPITKVQVAKDSNCQCGVTGVCTCGPDCQCKCPKASSQEDCSPPKFSTLKDPPFAKGVEYKAGITYELRNGELHYPTQSVVVRQGILPNRVWVRSTTSSNANSNGPKSSSTTTISSLPKSQVIQQQPVQTPATAQQRRTYLPMQRIYQGNCPNGRCRLP